jgi:NAD+ synthase (glutamine-hydrolysing)
MQAAAAERYHRVEVPFALTGGKFEEVREEDMIGLFGTNTLEVRYHRPEEEIALVHSKLLKIFSGKGSDAY